MGRPKIFIFRPKFIILVQNYFKSNPKLIFLSTEYQSESDTDFIQDITIRRVFVASICSENETPAKAKRGLNQI